MSKEENAADAQDGTLPDEWEEVSGMFYGHILNLLQQNPFFIAHGFYVFSNGDRWDLEDLERWANSDDKETAVKDFLQ